MKRIRISKLMDEYMDTEFFPTGGNAVDSKTVKRRVLANIKTPVKKKQLPRKKKVWLAAALAAILVMLAGAGFPYIQHRLAGGGALSFEQKTNERIITYEHNGEIVSCEDGRLIFNCDDGRHINITDLVSEETPYIYDGSDPDNGLTYYIIMGGTPELFGWFEWIQVPYPFDDNGPAGDVFNYDGNGNPVKILLNFELKDPEYSRGGFGASDGTVYLDDNMKLPWLLAGLEQLGIAFKDSAEYQ